MNPIFDIIFTATWIILLVSAIRLMSQGWNMEPPKPPKKKFQEHPEMSEVQEGDELLVVNFTPDQEFTDKVKESDSFLSESLKDRIDELNDPWDDDEDDDGDILVTRK